jgi:thiol reductant ABC exporter CydC subunit
VTSSVLQLLRFAPAPRRRFAVAVLLGAATVLFGVGLMATAGYLISRAAEQPAILSLTVAIVGVRFFGLARPVARYLERLTSHDVALRVLGPVRRRVYEHIEPLAPVELDGYRQGDLLSRLVADVDALQNLHLRGIGPPLVALASGCIAVAATTAFLPAAGVALGVGLLAGAVLPPLAGAGLGERSGRREAPARGELTAELVETISGAAELTVYGREEDRLNEVRETDGRLLRTARRAALADGVAEAVRLTLMGLTVAAVLAFAVAAHSGGRLDGVLIALLGLLALASFEAVQPLAQAARELVATITAGERVLELTRRSSRVVDPVHAHALPAVPFPIVFENVRVRYDANEAPALDNFDLHLAAGSRLALVGPSGAGKTTVTNLLFRFLDPERGRITLAGRDLREYRADDVRSVVALAGQEAHLFSATIRDNILLGRSATEGDLVRVLRDARLEEWVAALPDGVETLVGEVGTQVSGGQRQRIVLARALLGNEPLLVLDEPTAHLDPPNAERLIEDVFAAAGNRAVLLITHRPEGLDAAEELVRVPARTEAPV